MRASAARASGRGRVSSAVARAPAPRGQMARRRPAPAAAPWALLVLVTLGRTAVAAPAPLGAVAGRGATADAVAEGGGTAEEPRSRVFLARQPPAGSPDGVGASSGAAASGEEPPGGHVQDTATVQEMTILTALGALTGGFWFLMLAISCYVRWNRGPQRARASKKKRITATDIEMRFPAATTDGKPTCIICLSVVEADELCRTTQCGHVFHADCLEAWWLHRPRKSLSCPVCRARQKKKASSKTSLTCPSADCADASTDLEQLQQDPAMGDGSCTSRAEVVDLDRVQSADELGQDLAHLPNTLTDVSEHASPRCGDGASPKAR